MTNCNHKITSIFSERPELESVILPLLKITKLNTTLSIEYVCNFLLNKLSEFLFKTHDDSEECTLSLIKIDTYFNDVLKGTLYDIFEHTQEIQESLTTLTAFLLDSNSLSTIDSYNVYQELFLAINERSCIDAHKYSLNSLLTYVSFSQFSTPIRKVLHHLHDKMSEQIRLQLFSLDHHVFKGFFDTQSIHFFHITHMILDDLYHIAGGRYAHETDILINRTHLAYDILEPIFMNKLTIRHLLKEGELDWKFALSRSLSCSISHSGEIPLSLLDLSQADEFLDFLVAKKYLTITQKNLLKMIDTIQDDSKLDFLKPLVNICTIIGQEKVNYTPLFSELLLTYINQKIHTQLPTPSKLIHQSNIFLNPPIPKFILSKVRNLFINPSPDLTFTFDEIELAMHLTQSEFHLPFLKPYLPLNMIMMARCHPEDALRVYMTWLQPKPSSPSTQDCLLLLANSNFLSAKKIGLSVFTGVEFKSTDTNLTLIERILMYTPQTVTEWLENKFISGEELRNLKTEQLDDFLTLTFDHHPHIITYWLENNLITFFDLIQSRDAHQNTILHWLSRETSPPFQKWIDMNFTTAEELIGIRDSHGSTVGHWLAQYNPKVLDYWIQHAHITVEQLMNIRDKDGNSICHWLAQHSPKTLVIWVDLNLTSVSNLLQNQDFSGDCILHWLSQYYPDIFDQWIDKQYTTTKELFSFKDNNGNSIIHWLINHNPQSIERFLEKNLLTMKQLINDRNLFGETAIHQMALHSPQTIATWVCENKLTLLKLSKISDFQRNSVLHFITRYHPCYMELWVDQKFVTVNFLMTLKNADDESILHLLARDNPQTLEKWFSLQYVTFEELSELRDGFGNSCIHWLAQYNPNSLALWVELDMTSILELSNIKDHGGNTILHWLTIYSSEIIDSWVNQGKITIKDLMNIKDNSSSSLLHWLAQYSADILELWVDNHIITIQELISCKNDTFNSVIHWLAQHNPSTLDLWVEKGLVSVHELIEPTTIQGNNILFWLEQSSPEIPLKWGINQSFHENKSK